jgi:hypothetical protein
MEKFTVAKAYVDDARTIPVDLDDAEIKAMTDILAEAQAEVLIAVTDSKIKVKAAAAAVQRALPYASNEYELEASSVPAVIGIVAELKAAREQAQAANEITITKMKAVVDILTCIESLSRLKNPQFN